MSVHFERHKPRRWLFSLAYKLPFGLDFWLDLEWIAWRLAYEKAATGDLLERPNGFLLSRIRPEHSVLDVGCNTGHLAATIKAKRVVGVDSDPAIIARGKQMFPQLELVCADARDYLASGHRFDVLVLSHILEHLDEPERFLSSLAGQFSLIFVDVPDFEASPLNPVRVKRKRRLVYSDNDHVVEFDRHELQTMFARCGLKVLDQEFIHGWMRFWLSGDQSVRPVAG